MPVDYAEALRDLDTQIATLEADLEILRTTRPGFVLLRNRQNPAFVSSPVSAPRGRYTGLGNQAAVRMLMADGQLRTKDEIYEQLRDGGFTSEAANPLGSIGATLSQMKDELERVEDRWRKSNSVRAPGSPDPTVEHLPLAAPIVWQTPSSQ